jgi:hypothetical protein
MALIIFLPDPKALPDFDHTDPRDTITTGLMLTLNPRRGFLNCGVDKLPCLDFPNGSIRRKTDV